MPVSADQTQIAIVRESTYGVTPATPIFLILPITGESLVGNANTELSQSLNPSRQDLDSILTGMDVAGSLDFEFAKTPAMTLMLESALGSDTVSDTTNRDLFVGQDQISYTVEKRWPDPATPGEYLYHRYTGCVSNTFTLNMAAGASITGSCGVIGKQLTTDTTEIVGATYPDLTSFEVFRGPDVASITIDNEGGTLAPTLTDACVTDITVNLNNNYRGIQCLGTLGNKETVIGKFNATYDQTIFFSHNQLMDDFLAQSIINETVVVGNDTTDDHYTFITTKGKFASNEVVAGGTGTDVVNANTVNWLYDTAIATPTTIEISTSEGL